MTDLRPPLQSPPSRTACARPSQVPAARARAGARALPLLSLLAALASCGGAGTGEIAQPAAAEARAKALAVTPQQAALARWSARIPLSIVPSGGAVMANGQMLFWSADGRSGFGGTGRTYTTVFDPATNLATERLVSETGHSMFCPGTARLPDGRLLINGGLDAATTSLYDPVANTWTRGPNMAVGRGYNASVSLSDGSVLTLGGSWSGGNGGVRPAEIYTPGGSWRTLSGIPASPFYLAGSYGGWQTDSHYAIFPTANGRVLLAGPTVDMGWLDPRGNGSWSAAGKRGDDTPSLGGNWVMYEAGKILKTGGAAWNNDAPANANTYAIDTTGGGAVVRKLAPMAYPRVYAVSVVLPNGQVMVVGGQTYAREFSDDFAVLAPELWDPETETFTVLPPMAVARNYHGVALLMPDGRVASAGGGLCNCAADHPDMQILSPPYLFNADGTAATRPVITAAPATLAYGSTVAVSTNATVAKFSLVRVGANTHTVDNGQRRIAVSFTASSATSYSLSIPSNPSLLLPGQWMLFAMNAQGTPSLAKIVTVSAASAPVLQNPGDVVVNAGSALNLPVAASTPSGVLTFSATGLPPGVSISAATGTLSGTPTVAGSYLVTVNASNGSQTVSTNLLISVNLPGSGSGLLAQYFGNTTVSGSPLLQRVEAPDFDWGTSAPGPGVPADLYSVRWTGWIEAPATGAGQLQTLSDDGVRVWLDKRLVIDNWTEHASTANAAAVNWVAGQRYPITIEYYDAGGFANLRLQWLLPGASTLVSVPASRLYAAAAPPTTNLAQGKAATQSSQFELAAAARAVDGNTSGVYVGGAAVGSVSITAGTAAQDWWQVDLGQASAIDHVKLWNRTDCCGARLANFTLFVSATTMTGRSFDQLNADPAVLKRQVAASQINPSIGIPIDAQGRFVRVQLNGLDFLQLAEVQVFGTASVVYGTPSVNPIAAQSSNLGAAVSLAVVASDPNGNSLSYSATGLPPGLAVNAATGVIAGTPTSAGSFNVNVSAGNAGNLSASRSFVWTIVPAGLPTVLSLPAPVAASGGSISYAPVLSGGAGATYSWDFGDGSAATAPASTAAVSRSYANPGVYTVTLTMRAADGTVGIYRFVQAIYPAGAAAASRASSNLLLEPRSGNSARLWVVNADNDSVSIFDTGNNSRLAEITVGAAPRTLARAADGRVWVVNRDAASISIIDPASLSLVQTLALPRASQPHGIVISAVDGNAYVTLEASGSLIKLNPSGATVASLDVGSNPRHLALTAAGSQILLSRFITRPLPGESTANVLTADAAGNKLGAEVLSINPATMAITRTTVLAHSERIDSENQGRGMPNYLGAAAISPDGKTAWVPSKQDNIRRGALRDNQALNFQSTVRAVSSLIDLASGTETLAARIDHDNASLASAAVFHPTGAYLFVALETSRQVAVVDAAGRRELFRFEAGLAPQGLVVSSDGLKLFVSNFMSRSLSVVDLQPLLAFGQLGAAPTATLGSIGSDKLAATVLKGKQLFYDARDPRLARDSYMSCASCHNDGGHDGRVWDFSHVGEGLRNTISLRGRGAGHGRLHWSANFDEVQDFEAQIRALAGGTGLMSDAQFNTGTRNQPLGDSKAGISGDLDALAAYVGSLTSFAPSPARLPSGALTPEAITGKAVFTAKCASCHEGTAFSDSAKKVLHNIGTQNAASGQRLGQVLNGIDAPTLRDVWATAPYLHNGSAASIEAAVQAHGLNLSAPDLAAVASYTRQIGGEEAAAPSSSANLVVRALASLVDRVGALYEVRVNSSVVRSGQLDAEAWVDLFIDVATLVKDAVIEVVFKNDAGNATEDRNLAVQSIRVNGSATLEASAAGVVIDAGQGAAAFDGLDTLAASVTGGWLPWDAAIRFKAPATAGSTDTVTVRGSATLAGGVGAQIELRINGVLVGSRLVASTVVQNMVFTTPAIQVGDRIDVVFTNDAMINGEDRNLYVESVTARGVVLPATAAGVIIDAGGGAQAFDGLDTVPASSFGGWIPWNGALRLVAK